MSTRSTLNNTQTKAFRKAEAAFVRLQDVRYLAGITPAQSRRMITEARQYLTEASKLMNSPTGRVTPVVGSSSSSTTSTSPSNS